jgi:2-polyprenyl-6-hydroxyphenyl methylase / 3-demethylubiquinone-9 3-methyltransferase
MNADARAQASDPAEIAKFEALAHRFWDEHGEFRPLHLMNPVRARFVRERVTLAGARILDVGCGGGLLPEALARDGARVTGIDLAPAMIEVAKLHAADERLAIDYRVLGAEELARSEAGAFDTITCMEMLEHVPDPGALFAAFGRIARPGGQLFVSTINRNLKSFALAIVGAEYVLRLLPRGTHAYERLIRPAELARHARAAAFELRELAGLHFNPLTEECRLTRDVSVNYLAHFVRAPEGH